ncbi:MAG: type IX secretion system membrane protein PorP/SprF [Bacteroidales bacterium]|nr:type IX secretion system membrane protein PorP/SprF [Bacteroidales bacterium]
MAFKKVAYILALLGGIGVAGVSRAQIDAPLNPGFDFNMMINPALCGLDGEAYAPFYAAVETRSYKSVHHSLGLNYKNQLKGAFSSNSLRIISANYQCRFSRERMALGVYIYSNTLNKQALRDFQIMINYAYHWTLVEDMVGDPLHRLSFGVQAGYRNYSYQTDNMLTGDMYDPSYTHGINLSLVPSDELADPRNLFDGHAGVSYMGRFDNRARVEAGVGAFHLLRPKTGALEDGNFRIPLRFVAFAQAVIAMGSQSQLETGSGSQFLVGLYYSYQSDKHSSNSIASTVSARVGYRYVFNASTSMGVALVYRTRCAFIPQVSFDIANFSLLLQMEANANYSYNNMFSIGLAYRF